MKAVPSHQVAETPAFTRQRNVLGLSAIEYEALLDIYAADPRYGSVVVGTGGLRKGRVARAGGGKSGGYRVFSLYLGDDAPVFLLWLIDKSEDATITEAQKVAFKSAINLIKRELRA